MDTAWALVVEVCDDDHVHSCLDTHNDDDVLNKDDDDRGLG